MAGYRCGIIPLFSVFAVASAFGQEVPSSVRSIKATPQALERYHQNNGPIWQELEAARETRETQTATVSRLVPEYTLQWFCYRGRWRCRWVIRYRTVYEQRIVAVRGIDWSDPRVGETRPEDGLIKVTLPPLSGARIDFIKRTIENHAANVISPVDSREGRNGVILVTRWMQDPANGTERQFSYDAAIVNDAADEVVFIVRIKERPINFRDERDYILVSDSDANAELNRFSAAARLPIRISGP